MQPAVKQGLILGLIVGVLVSLIFWSLSEGNPISLIIIPVAAIMGAASQMIKPGDHAGKKIE